MGNSHGKPILLTDEVTLNHFRLLRVVGKGAFGKVRIVERKDTGLTFALKYIRKDEVVRSESVRNIIRERRMLEHLNHPFLCNLRYSFQDVEYLYIVVDLMTGGDLRFHITRKTFMEEAVRFWIAELGCALRYIHQQGIVHRDVKPDNVLLDAEGHVHLADFNVASDFTPARALNSRSGTLAYLAPEVYAGRGYFSEVDWWSLGVLFYECIYNKRPFEANHPDALAQAVMKANVQYPKTSPPISQPCLHAISSLLERDRTRRIGAVSFDSFTDNPFFREIDFEALERKEVEPIFCPSSEKTNFDATYDLEELLLEEAPLEARARKQKPRAELREDATQQEIRADELHRMVETMFEPFNYTLLPQHRDPAAQGIASVPVPAGLGNSTMISGGMGPSNVTRSRSKVRTHDVDFSGILDRTRSGPPSRTQTATGASLSHNNTNTRSSTHSPNGSPPLSTIGLPPNSNFIFPPLPDGYPPMPPSPLHYQQQAPYQPSAATSSGGNPQQIRSHDRPRNFRSASLGGSGSQVVLEPRPSCNDLSATPQQHRQHPGSDESRRAGPGEKASGVIAFFNRKKGRDRSPKPPKERERGVLGKEGARVIVSPG